MGVAVFERYGDELSGGKGEETLSACGGDEAVEDGWSEEPAREGEPYRCGGDKLQDTHAARPQGCATLWAGK